jgi:transglutaminase domain protein
MKLEIVVSILDKESEMRKNWLKIPVFSAVLVLTASFVAQAQQSWKLNEGAWRCYEDGVVLKSTFTQDHYYVDGSGKNVDSSYIQDIFEQMNQAIQRRYEQIKKGMPHNTTRVDFSISEPFRSAYTTNTEVIAPDLTHISDMHSRLDNGSDWLSFACRIIEKEGKSYLSAKMSDAEVVRYVEENAVVNRFVQDFAKNIQSLSDEEKVAVISNYILDHVQYDDTLQNYTAYHALQGKAICNGYAQLFFKMAKASNLSVRYVEGKIISSGELHAWNQVKIGDTWRSVDTTYASSAKNRKYLDLNEKDLQAREIAAIYGDA